MFAIRERLYAHPVVQMDQNAVCAHAN